jgi:DnaK suppressor protein
MAGGGAAGARSPRAGGAAGARSPRAGGASLCGMESDRARQLLAAERERIERQLGALQPEDAPEGSGLVEPGDRGSEDLYQGEFDEGRRGDLAAQLAAVERAEERLVAGTYGLSIESGDPIPDARLEALPTAERTVDEERRRR